MTSRQASRRHEHQYDERDNHESRNRRQLHIDTSLASSSTASAARDRGSRKERHGERDRDTDRGHAPQAANYSSSSGQHHDLQPNPPYSDAHTPAKGNATRHDPNESFLESRTPIDAEVDMSDEPRASLSAPRDSHDLSYSPRDVTRDSLVTNMLLSLDQFSMSAGPHANAGNLFDEDTDDYSSHYYDIPRYRSNNDITAQANNWQSGHQYSYSSDYDGTVDDTPTPGSKPYSRGRRSNSSTTQQEVYAKLNSNRPPPSRGNHVRGGKGSKSSSVTSMDTAQPSGGGSNHYGNGNDNGNSHGNGSQRWNRGVARASSFDNGQTNQARQQAHPQLEDVPQSPFRADFINSFLSDDMDAAPMPTVPGGPRKTAPSTPTTPKPPPEPKERSSSYRNRSSSRSVKSSSGRNKAAHSREAAPPIPTAPAVADLEPAPAPNVGYGKSKESAKGGGAPAAAPQPKEKQGFFKKFFGGGSSKNTSTTNSAVNSPAPETPRSAGRLNTADPSSGSPVSNSRMQTSTSYGKTTTTSAPPSRDTASSHSNAPTLQKKSSSFFRRRKKSVADEAPPVPSPGDAPPVPLISPLAANKEQEKLDDKAEPSPVSSLRQVMNPYLRESALSPGRPMSKQATALADITNTAHDRDEEPERYQREFSPDYEPSPNARIRKVASNLDRDHEDDVATPTRTMKEKTNNSFLDLDGGSDNEDDDEGPAPEPKSAASKSMSSPMGHAREEHKEKHVSRPKMKRSSRSLAAQAGESSPQTPRLALPMEGTKASRASSPNSARSGTPKVRGDSTANAAGSPKIKSSDKLKGKGLDEPEFVVGEPTEDDRQKAQKIYDGNEDFIQKEKAAAWMGEEGLVRQRTLQAYMELYDFTNQSIVHSLRQVCSLLLFRAETQQVDRILVAFSKRWCACNPNHGFKATDVIHTICYSIMLLNTDLHMADIEQKMTRSQFVKNTMGTIVQAVNESAPDAFGQRPSILPEKGSSLTVEDPITPTPDEKKSFRNSFLPPGSATSDLTEDCGPLVKTPYNGTIKGWEEQVEYVLKGIYSSIRDEKLPLFGADPGVKPLASTPSQSSLSVIGMLKRTPSVLSKAPSEGNLSMLRGRGAEGRSNNSRWTSKSRSRPGMGRHGLNSSRTSFDDNNSVWSPAMSSATWSRQSLGRTQTSVSQDSLGSAVPRGDYQQSIGFANALSQAIIRDEDAFGNESTPSLMSAEVAAAQLLDDESLELSGPPWMKEGMVIHKHHLDGVGKKARERNWSEVFAVIQKGQMSLFSFSSNHKSARNKTRAKATGPVGGGNWQDNATNVGSFNLRQTLASALPPPGYSRTRPHVWALSLPTGAVHLFQVGTPELIKEFVTTANYWSARRSTHPLVGGISNIEYGWSENIVNNALVSAINDDNKSISGRSSRPGSSAAHGRKSSVSSFRSASIDQAAAAFTKATGGNKLPGDRIHIAEWTPPSQSLRPSNSGEKEQLETLQAYVKGIEEELQGHNQLRSPMLLAFTPRGHNAGKAMANWERKSAYLLREIVKFRTYVDCLQQADGRKQEVYAERELAQKAARGELSDGDMDVSGDEEDEDEGDVTLKP